MVLTSLEKMIHGLKQQSEPASLNDFKVKRVIGRGRSVFANKNFQKGDFVMEYKGTCTKFNSNEYQEKAKVYDSNGELSYCLEFWYEGKKYCIDATREYDNNISRLVNHVRNPNLKLFRPVTLEPNGNPRIAMFAAENISTGDELFWNYFSSFNPVKCMLDKNCSRNIPRWIFSYRNKSGQVFIKPPKVSKYKRDGTCFVCLKYCKRLSNHLITVHKIKDKSQRLEMIRKGKTMKSQTENKQIKKSVKPRRPLMKCTVCFKDVRFLSTHLKRIHNKSDAERKCIMHALRMQKHNDDIERRKKDLGIHVL